MASNFNEERKSNLISWLQYTLPTLTINLVYVTSTITMATELNS